MRQRCLKQPFADRADRVVDGRLQRVVRCWALRQQVLQNGTQHPLIMNNDSRQLLAGCAPRRLIDNHGKKNIAGKFRIQRIGNHQIRDQAGARSSNCHPVYPHPPRPQAHDAIAAMRISGSSCSIICVCRACTLG